jgi:hypothetical protein
MWVSEHKDTITKTGVKGRLSQGCKWQACIDMTSTAEHSFCCNVNAESMKFSMPIQVLCSHCGACWTGRSSLPKSRRRALRTMKGLRKTGRSGLGSRAPRCPMAPPLSAWLCASLTSSDSSQNSPSTIRRRGSTPELSMRREFLARGHVFTTSWHMATGAGPLSCVQKGVRA